VKPNKVGMPEFMPLTDNCHGCEKAVVDEDRCSAYINPAGKWRNGDCNLATHVEAVNEPAQTKKIRVGQQKQKKYK